MIHRLSELPVGGRAVVATVGGGRALRRRLMELGLLPGTTVSVLNVAPFGDPLELEVRGCRLSIRRGEAAQIELREVIDAVPDKLTARRLKVVS